MSVVRVGSSVPDSVAGSVALPVALPFASVCVTTRPPSGMELRSNTAEPTASGAPFTVTACVALFRPPSRSTTEAVAVNAPNVA